MSSFYKAICEHYDNIFPTQPAQVSFVLKKIEERQRVLELGAATGNLAVAIAQCSKSVTGVDLSGEMLTIAEQKSARAGVSIEFLKTDIKEVASCFQPHAFDAAVCVGNTLVHLENLAEVTTLCKDLQLILSPQGVLIVQIINYDRILNQQLSGLPTIDNEHIRFERHYQLNQPDGRILFHTALTIKSDHRILDNEVRLYPLRQSELEQALCAAGFKSFAYFGGFNGAPFNPDNSQPLIVVCKKGIS